MNDWKKVRSKAIIIEILAVFAIAVFIVIGLLLQLHSNTILGMISNNIDKNFALAILQIQATVDTLTISIIALISGCVSDSSMGIVFSDYYLNITPLYNFTHDNQMTKVPISQPLQVHLILS